MEKMVKEYFKLLADKKELDAKVNEAKAALQKYLKDNHTEEVLIPNGEKSIKVTYKPSERSRLDEDVAIDILKSCIEMEDAANTKQAMTNCIKTKEVLDTQLFESLLYNGLLDCQDFDDATSVTEVWTLRCTEVKNKKSKEN